MVDMLLVIVTVISLAFASVMGIIVWRVLHLERQRSSGRVAALVDAAVELEDEADEPRLEREPSPVHRGTDPAAPLWTDLVIERTARVSRVTADDSVAAAHLFRADEAPESNGRRLVAGFALATMFLGLAGAVVVSVSGRADTSATPAESTPPPLELLELEHTRTGGQLAIRGVVRNPVTRGATENLVAVVFLFDRNGGYLGTLKQPVVETALSPGSDAPFQVTVSDRLPVGRYRLTFHVGRSPVPHLDRRGSAAVDHGGGGRPTTPARGTAALSAAAVR